MVNLYVLSQYNTCSASSGNYYIIHSRLNRHKNSFFIVGEKFGTAFLKAIEDYQSTLFKQKIQALLFVALETLDSYADTSTLIFEIKKAS